MNADPHNIPQGARIVLRDAEWLVRRTDNTSGGRQKLTVVGLSEIVRDKEKLFLTEYEEPIRILDPADTKFVLDDSDRYMKTRLFIEIITLDTVN